MSSSQQKLRWVRVHTRGGPSWTTEIRGTIAEVRNYFRGRSVDVAGPDQREKLRKVTRVEFLDDQSKKDLEWDAFEKQAFPRKRRR